jgi:hypothetical protein
VRAVATRSSTRPCSPSPVRADSRCRGAAFVSRETPGRSICASISQLTGPPCPSGPSHSTRSAPAIASRARSMPIASIASAPSSRSPAVSVNTKGIPPSATGASIRSRVVPAISETIAASRWTSALSKVDLPLLGGPASTTRTPSRSRSARGRASAVPISPASAAMPCLVALPPPSPTSSSSEKSSSASTCAESCSTACRHPSTWRDRCPLAMRIAATRCASVSANSRSASPSASARSIRPLRNARRVNSPGSASRSPGMRVSTASTARTTARPPCR